MNFLCDENVPRSICNYLRMQGHDVSDIIVLGLQGIPDTEIVKLAQEKKRVIVSFDQDFLYLLADRQDISAIILHFPRMQPQQVIFHLQSLLEKISNGDIKFPGVITLSESEIIMLK